MIKIKNLESEYLKLENFATIYSGMKRKSIEIDFTKCKNKIVLLIGDNGTGKTAILSELHPFAYAGSMDVRSDSSIIMPDKNGYKEIHISHEGNLYIIKHHYKNNKGKIMVKSFISKNGEELNANGNVTSFLSLVKQELTIEQDYLKSVPRGGVTFLNAFNISGYFSGCNTLTLEPFEGVEKNNKILTLAKTFPKPLNFYFIYP